MVLSFAASVLTFSILISVVLWVFLALHVASGRRFLVTCVLALKVGGAAA